MNHPQPPYTDAPLLLNELITVLRLTRQLGSTTERTPEAVHEQQLRKAALLDRIAMWEATGSATATATQAARRLAAYDREHHTSASAQTPDSRAKTNTYRDYVRQEYDAWLRAHH